MGEQKREALTPELSRPRTERTLKTETTAGARLGSNDWLGEHPSTWQPIETAPKDGTQVLLYAPRATVQITGGYWSDNRRCRCWIAGGYMQKTLPPTHWMPLPLPPNARIEPTRHLAEILQEEMDERGWTRDDLALRMGPTHDDFGINRLALDLFMEVRNPNVILGVMDGQFAIAFGVSKEFFNNLHEAWRAAQRQEKSHE